MYRTNFGIGHSIKDLLEAHIPPGGRLGRGHKGLYDTINNSIHFQLGLALASLGVITSLTLDSVTDKEIELDETFPLQAQILTKTHDTDNNSHNTSERTIDGAGVGDNAKCSMPLDSLFEGKEGSYHF
ncbi:hypothetical protein GQ457_16G019520 [Hibiscus cannabinus]